MTITFEYFMKEQHQQQKLSRVCTRNWPTTHLDLFESIAMTAIDRTLEANIQLISIKILLKRQETDLPLETDLN